MLVGKPNVHGPGNIQTASAFRGMHSGIHMVVQAAAVNYYWSPGCQDDMSKVTMEERDDVTLAASMVKLSFKQKS